MAKFIHAKTLTKPEDARPFLGDPEKHWKAGRSAMELATSWIGSGGIPATVADALASTPGYKDSRLVLGSLEHETALPGGGRPSQTDLLALVASGGALAVIGVEGKVSETFGPRIAEWNDGSPGKTKRWAFLRETLQYGGDDGTLRYQLFHRTASAVLEARSFGAARAMMLVHSFCPDATGFADFSRFADALGLKAGLNGVTDAVELGDVELRLAWVSDKPMC